MSDTRKSGRMLSSNRQAFQYGACVRWVKSHRTDVWEAIEHESYKRYPARHQKPNKDYLFTEKLK